MPNQMSRPGLGRRILALPLALCDLFHPVSTTETDEQIGPNESALFDEFVRLACRGLDQRWDDNPPCRRDFHAKSHGLVKAWFEIDADLPADLRHGVFAQPGQRFPTWIRFSNGAVEIAADRAPDTRGIAIKLMGVPGKKIITALENAPTQDFLLCNFPVFAIQGVDEYTEFERDLVAGKVMSYFLSVSRPRRLHRFRQFLLFMSTVIEPLRSPVESWYWSQSAYKCGPHNVKYRVRPVAEAVRSAEVDKADPECLGQTLRSQLAVGEVVLRFEVQRQVVGKKMPVEDPTYEWRESDSAFQQVARLRILQQDPSTPSRRALDENISFNPGHSLPEHRPLGGMNRIRQHVYQAICSYRHRKNDVTLSQPGSWDE